MKTLLYVIKSLIQINFVIAVFSILFVMAVRERKTETVLTTQSSNPPDTFRHEIKENLSDDQRKILTYRQQIQHYEQTLKQQEAELEHYKAQQPFALDRQKQPSNASNFQQPQERGIAPSGSVHPFLRNTQPTSPRLASVDNPQPTEARLRDFSGNASSLRSKLPTASALVSPNTQVIPLPLAIAKTPSIKVVAPSLQPAGQLRFDSPSASGNSQAVGTVVTSLANAHLFGEPSVADNRREPSSSVTTNFDLSFQLLPHHLPQSLANPQKMRIRTAALEGTSAPIQKTALAPANHLANDITMGLLIAGRKGHINYGTRTYRQVQTAIRSLRNRKSNDIGEAARLANLSPDLLKRLAKSGEDRPGNLENSPISLGIQP